MDDFRVVDLDPEADFARVKDLCLRAADYVRLESGRAPDDEFVTATLIDAPPQCGAGDVFLRGIEWPDGRLAGIATNIRHHYEHGEWYIGLLMLNPSERGLGLGKFVAKQVIDEARKDAAPCIRIAVLDRNPKGRKFWQSLGFRLEKSVQGDDHLRHVLKLELGEENDAT